MISLKIDIPTNIPNASNAEVEQIIFDALLNFANISLVLRLRVHRK